jgi:hypothetical protein
MNKGYILLLAPRHLLCCRSSTMPPHRLRRGASHLPARRSRQMQPLFITRPYSYFINHPALFNFYIAITGEGDLFDKIGVLKLYVFADIPLGGHARTSE